MESDSPKQSGDLCYVTEEAPDRRYFTIIPNIVEDSNLSPYAVRLYLHLKRVAGETGACWEGERTIAQKCHFSKTEVHRAKADLVEANLIRIEERTDPTTQQVYHHITLIDIWAENALAMRARQEKKGCPYQGQGGGPTRTRGVVLPGPGVVLPGPKEYLIKKIHSGEGETGNSFPPASVPLEADVLVDTEPEQEEQADEAGAGEMNQPTAAQASLPESARPALDGHEKMRLRQAVSAVLQKQGIDNLALESALVSAIAGNEKRGSGRTAESVRAGVRAAVGRGTASTADLLADLSRTFGANYRTDNRWARDTFLPWYQERVKAGESLEQFHRWWREVDWRGKAGQPPTLGQIYELWPQAFGAGGQKVEQKAIVAPDGGFYF